MPPRKDETPGAGNSQGFNDKAAAGSADVCPSVPRDSGPCPPAVKPDTARRRFARLADLLRWAAV